MKKILLVLALLLLTFPISSFAAEKSWEISKWDTQIRINPDASFDVIDTVTFDFHGSFSFVTRSIDNQKFDRITDYTVTDESGATVSSGSSLSYDAESDAYVSTLNFSAKDESRTFTFHYSIEGALGYFEDHDELYWNILPSERDVRVGSVSATVTLPAKTPVEKLQRALYTEGKNEKTGATDGVFTFAASDLGASTNFTIVAGFPTGIVKNPGVYRIESTPKNAEVFVNGERAVSNTPLALRGSGLDLNEGVNHITLKKFGYADLAFSITPAADARETIRQELSMQWWYPLLIILLGLYIAHPLFVLLAMIIHWRRRGRDPKGRGTIIAQYDPPLHLPPTLVGVLIDERVDMHDITATIIDLARRGYLHIKELPKGLLAQQDFELTLKKDFGEDSELRPYEKQFLRALFGSGKVTTLKEQREKFYKKIPGITKELYQEATDLAIFQENPDERRKKYAFSGLGIFIIGIITASFYGLGVPLMISGVVVLIFSQFMPRRTKKGVEALEYAWGFKEYLYRAERYRVQKLSPELFEKFLPYAMIFKIEKEWAKKFQGISMGSPSWYQSNRPFSNNALVALAVVNSMDRFTQSAVGSLTSAPGGGGSGASGSSGFSGGFSGGGGGGGGISAG